MKKSEIIPFRVTPKEKIKLLDDVKNTKKKDLSNYIRVKLNLFEDL